ncbi:hypothetical protein N7462_003139 [Penicillium macrosclerotiorum]|uniref:uncharacterized protein n=1 Tax=Penicillium macrosclerotiorum TaxID=303699 RepID=UPI00254891A8|nr:uncharacterized protein N7462_003139 [Penicillium macrosclerotiorum]KAJ5688747.1 hypothetical protein N7462_003139 [Penicillium macrosclerotiorum]
MALRRSRRSHGPVEDYLDPGTNMRTRSKRFTRASAAAASGSVTVSRSSEDPPGEPNRTLRLTVKMPAGKLREATGGRPGRRSVNVFQENPIVSGPRASRNKRKIVEVPTSDDEDIEDQEEDEVDDEDEDAPGEDDEDADADGDIDMDDAPPQPPARRAAKAATSTRGKTAKSVEAKEMELEEEEEEEEEEDEEDEEEEEEEEEADSDADADGEPDDQDESAVPEVNVDDLDEEDEEDDLEDDLDSEGVGMKQTTKRQRGNLGNDFLQLPMEPQVKKHLTAEERAMRRAEMARRRKNLSEKRNEEEKMDTINRLLRKQPPKRRGRAAAADGADTTPAEQEPTEPEKADPTMIRWTSSQSGCKVGVPEEWLGTPAGRVFGTPVAAGSGKMVEEL